MLPFAFGNNILACVQNLVVEYTDSPVESCWGKLLDRQNVAFLEEAFGYVTKAGFTGDFFHVFAETRVWRFDDDWFAELLKKRIILFLDIDSCC